MSSIHPGENSYMMDQESAVEMARLIDLDRLVTRYMGGLFPAALDTSRFHDILDIASGPGGWALEVAFAHPKKRVVGIDISNNMLAYARAQARVQGLKNVRFLYMDATSPLNFPDASFDFVNARFVSGFMWKEAWPKLLRECMRIVRPGGFIRLTESDTASTGVCNSLAAERLNRLAVRAGYNTGRSFCPDPDSGYGGITPMLRWFLKQAGAQNICEQAFALNYSVGTDGHAGVYNNLKVGMKLIQPFLLKTKVGTEEEIEQLYQEMLLELSQDDFLGIWYFTSAYAQKLA